MMRNIYAPLRLRQKTFDLIIGNPPWIALRYIDNKAYQEFLKKTAFKFGLLSKKETTLFTQMDTSTIFYCATCDCYMSNKGILAFVMPRSVLTGSKQHKAFKDQKKPLMKILKIIDTEQVNPLFSVDSCSIIARLGEPTKYPVTSSIVKGDLPEKNLRLKKALKYLTIAPSEYCPPVADGESSPYLDKMQNGAGVYPRTLWILKFAPGNFGLSADKPSVESLVLPDAKEPWNKIVLKGEIEAEFIFATLLSKYILPFRAEFLPSVLPIRRERVSWKMLKSEELRNEGKFKVAEWLDNVELAWQQNGTEKNLKRCPTAIDYVNYNNKLLHQRVSDRYYVVYTAGGTHIAAVMVDSKKLPDFVVGRTRITPAGFIPDHTAFYLSTNNSEEAYYLTGVLNSNVLDKKIKSIQTRGKFGPRHIHRRPFEFCIPMYDPKNSSHKQISVLSEDATKEVLKLPKASRLKIKNSIPSMEKIDQLVTMLFDNS